MRAFLRGQGTKTLGIVYFISNFDIFSVKYLLRSRDLEAGGRRKFWWFKLFFFALLLGDMMPNDHHGVRGWIDTKWG